MVKTFHQLHFLVNAIYGFIFAAMKTLSMKVFKQFMNLCHRQQLVSTYLPFLLAVSMVFDSNIIFSSICIAVVEDNSCVYMRNGSEGYINRTDIPDELVETAVLHSINLDCLWIIEVEQNSRVSISKTTNSLTLIIIFI